MIIYKILVIFVGYHQSSVNHSTSPNKGRSPSSAAYFFLPPSFTSSPLPIPLFGPHLNVQSNKGRKTYQHLPTW